MREPIKNFYNQIKEYIEESANGDVYAYDFYNRLLGKYIKSQNVTKDFYNRIVGKGNLTSALIYENDSKTRKR